MARSSVVKAAVTAPVFGEHSALRFAAGQGTPIQQVLAESMQQPDFAPVAQPAGFDDDEAYQRQIMERERAEGLDEPYEAPAPAYAPHATNDAIVAMQRTTSLFQGAHAPPHDLLPSQLSGDLSMLPEKIAFEIERKPDGWWVVRAPAVHVSLFVAHQDLGTALTRAPYELAEILRLDGPRPKPRERKAAKK